ncbi:hypothetical protein NGRA_0197 [Nosema granulosis]|uniref:DUF2415 domain-containing protein n=1 Tax=Nosema granulosis TaxID=83296 RepID=A0A9P6H3G7_9MICR|nr:hypothetical protein NGRA_0197 [Nosema granulosis]
MSTNEPNADVREVSNIIKKQTISHDIGVHSQHWQLRNMLRVDREELIYPNGYGIYSYNFKNKSKTQLTHYLHFLPTSFYVDENFLIVGGPKGQVVMTNRQTKAVSEITLTEAINNHIIVDNQKIHISNNDKTLKIFDMNLELIKTIEHTTQVNYCSISPDGKYLLIVGDTNEVVVYSNSTYEKIKTLRSTKDGGFSVSWNSMADVFAVATQDGYVCLWDIRSDEKLHVLASKQSDSHKGAVRNVFFSVKFSLDLLCFTEQFSYFTVFDSRTFLKKQVLNVFNEVQITGSAFLEEQSKIFVSSDTNIEELNVNTISRRIFDE